MHKKQDKLKIAVVGGGFAGLAACYEAAKLGHDVVLFEREQQVGGLASTFEADGQSLDKFYHFWYTSDHQIFELGEELGIAHLFRFRSTATGTYYSNKLYRLSSPFDLLTFSPIPFLSRVKLGFMVYLAKYLKDWQSLDGISAKDWLIASLGKRTYEIMWEPLLQGKFGGYADTVSAAWFWKKLLMRGNSRGRYKKEQLVSIEGGFKVFTSTITDKVTELGGRIATNSAVVNIHDVEGRPKLTMANGDTLQVDIAILTVALPIASEILSSTPTAYRQNLNKINYLGNVCLILELEKPLSEMYWININDPNFPFVGIIEQTIVSPNGFGKHYVYISKYLDVKDRLYQFSENEYLDYSLPFIQQVFPSFSESMVVNRYLWKERYSQPVPSIGYQALIPQNVTPLKGVFIASMAQIYPEDRGTNAAIGQGRAIVREALGTR